MNYSCPLCQQPLQFGDNGYRCANRHHFDQAKEGYVNLLPVQQKSSKEPGDSKAMMLARREFLHAGFYQCLSDAINAELLEVLSSKQSYRLLDLGCGEGYYTGRLSKAFEAAERQLQVEAIDISKSAIRFAAKRYPTVDFAVASAYQLPFADQSFDAIVRCFAPSQHQELLRLLESGGQLLTVTPGEQHLFELKSAIYPYPKPHQLPTTELEGFSHRNRLRVSQTLTIESGAAITALLNMTPFAWRMSDTQKAQLAAKPLALSLDFCIDRFERD
ncbi:23S rRNA (guanine(745)-N(1))-methyltransferase [Paraferrimonas sedimenticola]|uniref:23S rRNA (Guanine(745)-N(1))-methyltransferase n=1 Tax=Paraferrimonas sedimenticola TaxID=375674 RepID=A0AA37RXK3_9GAMM|nr:23S rRNA (guanine(745)-N(1))-methyltransferase [Paraferrimonas sedimenticola]GLP96482.1 23S rRNA (guanine(745)-N(1))-methyltransferase [Paraferrimonas sedimenticola]